MCHIGAVVRLRISHDAETAVQMNGCKTRRPEEHTALYGGLDALDIPPFCPDVRSTQSSLPAWTDVVKNAVHHSCALRRLHQLAFFVAEERRLSSGLEVYGHTTAVCGTMAWQRGECRRKGVRYARSHVLYGCSLTHALALYMRWACATVLMLSDQERGLPPSEWSQAVLTYSARVRCRC